MEEMFQNFEICQRESQQYNYNVKYTSRKKKQVKMNMPHDIQNSQHTLRKCVSVSGLTRHISVTNETPQTNTPDKRNKIHVTSSR